MKSMTGFGKGQATATNIALGIEIKSVNHRFCDINIKGPKVIAPFESSLKKKISESLSRGKIDVFINLEIIGQQGYEAKLNLPLADAVYVSLTALKQKFDLTDQITLNMISSQKDVLQLEEKITLEELQPCVENALDLALENMESMRVAEGAALKSDFQQRLASLEGFIKKIAERAPVVPGEWQEKLKQRLERFAGDVEVDPQRVAQELAIFADRCDITEELTRFNSHLEQFSTMLELSEPVGRKLDFLVQEINRETNTVGSKANDAEIGRLVVEVKAELEKIREQVQNVV